MSAKKTAWHPPFTSLLRERAPRWAKVTPEVQLTAEPLRVDDVIEVWAHLPHDTDDTGATLRGMWRFVVVVALLEFKSIAWPFQRGDLFRLLAYGMLWLSARPHRDPALDGLREARLSAHEVTLLLVVPAINAALRDELHDLGLTLSESGDGYHFVTGALLPLVVIDLSAVAEREDDDLLRAFAGRRFRKLETQQWMRQNQNARSDPMNPRATPDLEGYKEFVAFMLDGLTPEERQMGLTPEERLSGVTLEERLAGLPPEARLIGLPREHVVLALPEEILRALPDSYIATLPDDVQQKVRARRGH